MEVCDEDPDAPEGYEFVEECPAVGNRKEMMGKRIMFRWDCGWAEGVIKRRHTKGTLYNYFVLYKVEGASEQYRHSLKPHNYYNAEDQPDGVWVMLAPAAEV